MKAQPKSPAERLESAAAILEKEAKFLDELIASPVSANIANRIVVMTQMYKTVAEDIPIYLSRHASTLFAYKPDRVALVLKILLDEIARYARLAAYLSVKGIFPQAVSVLRNVIELIGVYTHIWHEPEKVDWIGDSDSKNYSRAFRYTPHEQLRAQIEARGVHYRFHHCHSAQSLTEFYKLLSGLFVHSGSLESVGLPASKADELSCYFVDRASPDDLQQQYRLIHGMFRDLPGRYSSPESRFRFPELVQACQWPKVPKMGLWEPKSGFPLSITVQKRNRLFGVILAAKHYMLSRWLSQLFSWRSFAAFPKPI